MKLQLKRTPPVKEALIAIQWSPSLDDASFEKIKGSIIELTQPSKVEQLMTFDFELDFKGAKPQASPQRISGYKIWNAAGTYCIIVQPTALTISTVEKPYIGFDKLQELFNLYLDKAIPILASSKSKPLITCLALRFINEFYQHSFSDVFTFPSLSLQDKELMLLNTNFTADFEKEDTILKGDPFKIVVGIARKSNTLVADIEVSKTFQHKIEQPATAVFGQILSVLRLEKNRLFYSLLTTKMHDALEIDANERF